MPLKVIRLDLNSNTFIVEVNKKYLALFNNISLDLIFIDRKLFERLLKTKMIENPKIKKILKPYIGKTNRVKILKWKKHRIENKSLDTLFLLLTERCNFNCEYCYVIKNFPKNFSPVDMSYETLKKIIFFFFSNIGKNKFIRVFFEGGEPLLNFQIMKEVTKIVNREAKKRGLKVRYILNTNGSILKDEIFEFFKSNKIFPIVSLDGREGIHNIMRKAINGKGTYKLVEKFINELIKRNISFGVSITVGVHNIKSLSEEIEFISKVFNPLTIGVQVPYKLMGNNKPVDVDKEEFAKKMIEGIEILCKNKKIEPRTMKRFYSFIEKKVNPLGTCPGTNYRVVVDSRGFIGFCSAFIGKKYFSSLDEKEKFWENLREWRQTHPFFKEKCEKCIAYGICGGGCPFNAYIEKGNIKDNDEIYCTYTREFLKWLIKKVYSHVFTKKDFSKRKIYVPTRDDRKSVIYPLDFDSKLVREFYPFFKENQPIS